MVETEAEVGGEGMGGDGKMNMVSSMCVFFFFDYIMREARRRSHCLYVRVRV